MRNLNKKPWVLVRVLQLRPKIFSLGLWQVPTLRVTNVSREPLNVFLQRVQNLRRRALGFGAVLLRVSILAGIPKAPCTHIVYT